MTTADDAGSTTPKGEGMMTPEGTAAPAAEAAIAPTPDAAPHAGVEPWGNVRVAAGSRAIVYLWEWEGQRPRRLRVLRSRRGYAITADDAWQGAGGQLTVYEGEGTSLRDAGLAEQTEYCYTFFVRDGAGDWRALLRERVSTVAADAAPRGRPLLGADGGAPGEGTGALLGALGDLADLLIG